MNNDEVSDSVVHTGVTNDRIDALVNASQQLTLAAFADAKSRTELQERARTAKRRFRVTMVAIGLTTTAVLVGIFVLLSRLNGSLDSGKQVRSTLLDCVQPSGKCFQAGQKSTAKAVGTITQISVLAAACAPDYVGLPINARIIAIEHCIERGLPK